MESQYEFVKEPESNLKCLICREVAENPKQEENCGKLFCTCCLKKLGEDKRCPHCRYRCPSYFKDRKSDTEIKDLEVKCKNTKHGCSWTGQLRYVQGHMTNSCDFTMEKCKHADIGCKEKAIRKRIREHEEDDSIHLSLFLDAVKKMREEKNSAHDGGKTIKLTNYKLLKQRNQAFVSEAFFSHPNGYKLILVVWPNGVSDVKNEYLSVAIKLLDGPHDGSLSWPFQVETTVTLLNQGSDSYHHGENHTLSKFVLHQVLPSNKKAIYYDPKFITHKELENNLNLEDVDGESDSDDSDTEDKHYLVNNTLYFRVTVQTPEYKPWLNVNLTS